MLTNSLISILLTAVKNESPSNGKEIPKIDVVQLNLFNRLEKPELTNFELSVTDWYLPNLIYAFKTISLR